MTLPLSQPVSPASLVSVILPVHNQADHLAEIVAEFEAVLARVPGQHELMLIENGSRDDSLKVCRELADEYPSVQALHSPHGGWGRAVKFGLKHASGDLICYTNSARTSPQDLLLMLLYATAYPNIVVKANRKIREGTRRRLGSLLYNIECRMLFDLANWDINGTPKVFPRSFGKLVALSQDDDLIDAEFSAICRREGYPMIEVPIFSSRRHGGKSTTNLMSAVKMYWGAYLLWRAWRKDGRPLPAQT
jgi:glycosyltransferase involved in cell wall biosynthesis